MVQHNGVRRPAGTYGHDDQDVREKEGRCYGGGVVGVQCLLPTLTRGFFFPDDSSVAIKAVPLQSQKLLGVVLFTDFGSSN